MIEAAKAGETGAQAAVSEAIEVSLQQGLDIATVNFAPSGGKNPFTQICTQGLGIGNDMWAETGNLLFPWHPNYLEQDICSEDPGGAMLLVDHVSIEWVLPEAGGQPADVLSDADFNRLRANFEAALEYRQANKLERPAFWGFVTHITEYAIGGEGENPPHPQAIAALDQFIQELAAYTQNGQVVFVTASEAGALMAHPAE
jgi:hypothetical protein